jgi:hypothetical protein
MKKQLTVLLLVAISFVSFSQSISVTFQVDMGVQVIEGNFIIGSSSVLVRGDFQVDAGDSLGNWQGNFFQLTDADGDSIYTGTFPIPSSFTGTTYNFKYVISTPGQNDIWESIPDRQFTLNPPAVIIPVTYFINDPPPILSQVTNTLNFTADISGILGVGLGGAFDPNQDSLLVMGLDWDNYGKNVIGNRKMINTDPFNTGIYTTTLTVTSGSAAPNGVGDSTNWKFKAYPDSRFRNSGWETGEDRWFIYQTDGSTVTLPTIVPRILPSFGTLPSDLDLKIYLDMTVAWNRYNGLPIPLNELEFIGIKGSEDFLGNIEEGCWCPDDTSTGLMKLLNHYSGNMWLYHTIVPAGTYNGLVEYKFGAMYPGADTINNGVFPLDNGYDIRRFLLVPNSTQSIVEFTAWIITDVEKLDDLIPSYFKLEQNYPNPFNPATKIRYSIAEYSFVTLKVFNLLGEEIETLFSGEQSAGVYEATFNASNLSSGIYFYTLKTNNSSFTKKMLLVR